MWTVRRGRARWSRDSGLMAPPIVRAAKCAGAEDETNPGRESGACPRVAGGVPHEDAVAYGASPTRSHLAPSTPNVVRMWVPKVHKRQEAPHQRRFRHSDGEGDRSRRRRGLRTHGTWIVAEQCLICTIGTGLGPDRRGVAEPGPRHRRAAAALFGPNAVQRRSSSRTSIPITPFPRSSWPAGRARPVHVHPAKVPTAPGRYRPEYPTGPRADRAHAAADAAAQGAGDGVPRQPRRDG